jgi:hypothetical protein
MTEPKPIRTRPEPGTIPGPGVCVFTELLVWSSRFFAFYTRTGRVPAETRRELEIGLGQAIRAAEEFLKD